MVVASFGKAWMRRALHWQPWEIICKNKILHTKKTWVTWLQEISYSAKHQIQQNKHAIRSMLKFTEQTTTNISDERFNVGSSWCYQSQNQRMPCHPWLRFQLGFDSRRYQKNKKMNSMQKKICLGKQMCANVDYNQCHVEFHRTNDDSELNF